jgi:Fe-S-cluster containining protein
MEATMEAIATDEKFAFACHRQLTCFNACCQDLNQFLTPYDIIRLKKELRLTSTEFLSRHARIHDGPQTGLPVVTLRSRDDKRCPFVTPDGCRVYDGRPASCRMYPLARAVRRDPHNGRVTEHYAVLHEPHCRGFSEPTGQSPAQWIKAQGLADYNRFNDMMLDIISLKRRLHPGPLDLKSRAFFQLACYDIDALRHRIASADNLMDPLNLPKTIRQRLVHDDTILMQVGFNLVRHHLFGQTDLLPIHTE